MNKPSEKKEPVVTNPPETIHQITPKDEIKAPFVKAPAKDVNPAPFVAAKGNDEVMSQPQQKS